MSKIIKQMDLLIGIASIIYFFIINPISLLRIKYMFLILGIILILYHFNKDKLNRKNRLFNILKKMTIIIMVLFIILESCMVFYPKKDKSTDCDYIIVLGALVHKKTITKSLQDRLDTCLEYLKDTDDDCYIVVSGGQGRGEDITEASAMKSYLISKGLDKDRIIEEDRSKTTNENFLYSKKIIEKNSNKDINDLNIKVVTTDFHTLRSKIISSKSGYKNVTFYTAKSNYKLSILNYTREFFALIANIIFNC